VLLVCLVCKTNCFTLVSIFKRLNKDRFPTHLLDCGRLKGGEVELKSRTEGRVGHNGGVARGVDGTGVHEQGTSW